MYSFCTHSPTEEQPCVEVGPLWLSKVEYESESESILLAGHREISIHTSLTLMFQVAGSDQYSVHTNKTQSMNTVGFDKKLLHVHLSDDNSHMYAEPP